MMKDFILKTKAGEIPVSLDDRTGITYLIIDKEDFEKLGLIIQDLIGMGYGYRVIEINDLKNPDPNGYTKEAITAALGITGDDLDLLLNGKCNVKIKGYGRIYNVSAETKDNMMDNVASYSCSMIDWDCNKLIVSSLDFYAFQGTYYMIRRDDMKFVPESDTPVVDAQ